MSEYFPSKDSSTEVINHARRRIFGTAAMTIAAAQLGAIAAASAQAPKPSITSAGKTGMHTSFKSLKQVNAGLLNVGYAEDGPADGPPVLLLHGWPYDIHSFVDVAPLLAAKGYRVIVPYLRGYGSTRFLSGTTFRNGQQSVVALDIIALMDALKIQKATIAGFDWGARTADIMAVLWPERCTAVVPVGGYLIGSPAANKMPLPPKAEFAWWYQYYFATENGLAGYGKYTHDFAKLIWQQASPKWNFDDATFDRSAAAFNNPDHVAITIHNYRWRIGIAEGESKYDELEKRLAVLNRGVDVIAQSGDAPALNGKPRRKYPRVLPKYRNPQTSETWSGRGKHPRWLVAAMKSGRKIGEFRIDGSKSGQKA